MGITERDRNRLQALILLIRPENSLASRVEKLERSERAQYEDYRARMSSFIAGNDIYPDGGSKGRAYELAAQGYGPQLPSKIIVALFGEFPCILKSDGDDAIAHKYRECCK